MTTAWYDMIREECSRASTEMQPSIYRKYWEIWLIDHRITLGNGRVELINWAGGNPHFEFTIKVVDSYTGEVRPLRIVEGISAYMIRDARPDPYRCPIVRWFHRTLRRLYEHEADEQFMHNGAHIFDPHNPDTRLSDQSLY